MTTAQTTAANIAPGMTIQVVAFSDPDPRWPIFTELGQNVCVDCGSFRKSSPTVTVETVELVDRHRSGRVGFGRYLVTATDGKVFTLSNRQRVRVVS
jgi:hypothetical protein